MPVARRSRQSLATTATAAVGAALIAGTLGVAPSAAAAPVVAPSAVHAPTATSMRWYDMPVLEPGARGGAVRMLQDLIGVKQTGRYGPVTLRAVTRFQKYRHLRAAGYVGPLTWRALFTNPPNQAKKSTARGSKATRSTTRPAVVNGRVCPAPGAAFGQGFGAARPGHLHQGQDMFDARGSRIRAIEAGVIVREGRQANGALRIVLQGVSGAKFFYGHMDRDVVHAGDRVARGETLGVMGDTGSPGAVHLHVEYWRSGGESAAVDPEPLLRSICR